MHIITVRQETVASAETVWRLFSDVEKRKMWDDSLKDIRIDGPFKKGATGSITLEGQPTRKFTILEVTKPAIYTDRFHLPLGASMDWIHTITDNDTSRTITFDVSVHGITSIMLGTIMKVILKKELLSTVKKLASVAESNA